MGTRAACALWVLSLLGCSLDLTIPDRGVASDAPGQLDGPGQVSPVIISTSGTCPTDHPVLLGGGGECTGSLAVTAASGSAKWTVICIPSELTAPRFALCGTPDLLGELSAVSCPGASMVGASCQCPSNRVLFSIVPNPTAGWDFKCSEVSGVNVSDGHATGQCLTTVTQPAQGDGTQTASAQCPGGYYVVSGGCDHPNKSGTIRASYPADLSTWKCESSSSSAKVRAHAVCWKP